MASDPRVVGFRRCTSACGFFLDHVKPMSLELPGGFLNHWPSRKVLDHFLIGFCCYCKSSLCILGTNLLSDMWFANIFSHSLGWFFTLLIVSFDAQKVLLLMKSTLFFSSCCLWFCYHVQKKSLPNPVSGWFPPLFSWKSLGFVVSNLRFRPLVHLELILVYCIR